MQGGDAGVFYYHYKPLLFETQLRRFIFVMYFVLFVRVLADSIGSAWLVLLLFCCVVKMEC